MIAFKRRLTAPIVLFLGIWSGWGITASVRQEVANSYNANGTLASRLDANNNKTSYFYDNFNRAYKACLPLAATSNTSSTTDCQQTGFTGSRVTSVTLRDNQIINFGYDAIGRINAKSGVVSETFTYNNFNLITSKTNNTTNGAAATETFGYNSLGWLMSDAQPLGTITYTYDAIGRRSTMDIPGLTVGYTYDVANRLKGLWESGVTPVVGISYNDKGYRSQITRINGITTNYGYDTRQRLQSIGTSANVLSFTYSDADQVKTRTNSNSDFAFNPSAKAVTYIANGLNQLSSVSISGTSTALTYDVRGNLTGDGGGTYVYNANNLLTSATQSGVTSTLSYDAQNRLFSIAKNGAATKFLYDGADVVAEYNGSGIVLRRYMHGSDMDEPLVWYEGASLSDRRFYHADNLGTITHVTNNSGTVLSINTYDEFGVPASGNAGRFQYTGQAWLPEIGMYNYKARLYNPVIGRFMQTDPIGYGDGMNMYNYVHSDPVNATDPWGLQGESENTLPPITPGTPFTVIVEGHSGFRLAVFFLRPSLAHIATLSPNSRTTIVRVTAKKKEKRKLDRNGRPMCDDSHGSPCVIIELNCADKVGDVCYVHPGHSCPPSEKRCVYVESGEEAIDQRNRQNCIDGVDQDADVWEALGKMVLGILGDNGMGETLLERGRKGSDDRRREVCE